MKVIFGSCIGVIIDPQMDLGETVRIVCALMYCKACCSDFSAAPGLPAMGGQVRSLALLSTRNNDSQVGSVFINKPDKKKKDIIPLWRLKDKFIIFSFDICFQWCSLCSGVFVRWLVLLLSTSCVLRGLAALSTADVPWFRSAR